MDCRRYPSQVNLTAAIAYGGLSVNQEHPVNVIERLNMIDTSEKWKSEGRKDTLQYGVDDVIRATNWRGDHDSTHMRLSSPDRAGVLQVCCR